MKSKRKLRIVLLLFLVCAITILGSGVVKGLVTRFFFNIVPVQYSVLEDNRDVKFIIIRHETAISSPASGSYNTIYQEGERVAKNTIVGYLVKSTGTSLEKTERIPVVAPCAGIISYKTDGFENLCNPVVWTKLDLDRLVEVEKRLEQTSSGDDKTGGMVEAGKRLFKIIDNLAPEYLFTEIDVKSGRVFQKGGTVDLYLDELEGLRIRGTVKDVVKSDSINRLLIEIPGTLQQRDSRIIGGSVVVDWFPGVVLEHDVLVERNGKVGVYLLKKGIITWQEVNITGIVGNSAALEGLASDDWIVTTPGLVKEGQRVSFIR